MLNNKRIRQGVFICLRHVRILDPYFVFVGGCGQGEMNRSQGKTHCDPGMQGETDRVLCNLRGLESREDPTDLSAR